MLVERCSGQLSQKSPVGGDEYCSVRRVCLGERNVESIVDRATTANSYFESRWYQPFDLYRRQGRRLKSSPNIPDLLDG